MKVKEVEIVLNSDGWWRFACGDVSLIGPVVHNIWWEKVKTGLNLRPQNHYAQPLGFNHYCDDFHIKIMKIAINKIDLWNLSDIFPLRSEFKLGRLVEQKLGGDPLARLQKLFWGVHVFWNWIQLGTHTCFNSWDRLPTHQLMVSNMNVMLMFMFETFPLIQMQNSKKQHRELNRIISGWCW